MGQSGIPCSLSLRPNRPVCCISRRKSIWLIWRSDQSNRVAGKPHMNAVRLAASAGVSPFIMRSRYRGLVAGAWVAVDGASVGMVGASLRASPGPAADAAAARRADEAR